MASAVMVHGHDVVAIVRVLDPDVLYLEDVRRQRIKGALVLMTTSQELTKILEAPSTAA